MMDPFKKWQNQVTNQNHENLIQEGSLSLESISKVSDSTLKQVKK